MKAFTLFFTPGNNRICPCAWVRSEYVLKSASSSLKDLSIHVVNVSSKMSLAILAACVSPSNNALLSIPHAIIASSTVKLGGCAAMLPESYYKRFVSSLSSLTVTCRTICVLADTSCRAMVWCDNQLGDMCSR